MVFLFCAVQHLWRNCRNVLVVVLYNTFDTNVAVFLLYFPTCLITIVIQSCVAPRAPPPPPNADPKSRRRKSLEMTPSLYLNVETESTWGINQMQSFSFTNQLSGQNQKVKQIINKPQPNKSASNFAAVATSDLNLEAMSFLMPATIKYNSVSEKANLTLKRQKRAQVRAELHST